MEYTILLPLALILLLSKLFGIICKKIGLPQVVGMLVAGVLVGLINYIPGQSILSSENLHGLSIIAKIGVVLIMFSAGIETDLKKIKSTGAASIVITLGGVLLPLALGFLVATAFNGGFTNMTTSKVLQNLFYGTILSATSVSVTVATLKELGKLDSKVGVSIISAAILDDIIGVILLSVVLGMNESSGAKEILIVLGKTVGFFAAAIAVGIAIHYAFIWMDKHWAHHRRLPVFGFAVCFLFAYAAEKWFGIADITGAYIAGLMLSGEHCADYIDRKIDISNYMIFGPVFFANIGLNTTFTGINSDFVWFGICFIAVGLIGKVVGCGLTAKLMRYSWKDSLRVGVGMMVRAEVVLVCAQKGVENNIVSSSIMPFILIMIILSTFLTPTLLKLLYKDELDNTPSLPPLEETGGTDCTASPDCSGENGAAPSAQ